MIVGRHVSAGGDLTRRSVTMTDRPKTRTPKKSETLEVRISHPLKRSLIAHCEARGVTVSDLVRQLIEDRLRQGALRPFIFNERISPMISLLKTRPRAAAGSAFASLAAMTLAVTAPSAATDGREVFERFDVNGDGFVAREEFVAGAVDHDAPLTIPADGELRPVDRRRMIGAAHAEFERYDGNGDGLVALTEFTGLWTQRMEQAFTFLDADQDGRLTAAELSVSFGGAGSQMARDLVAELDRNGDDRLSFEEFADQNA
jgi:Ca2+-binding EF-hand superfamily protein